MIIFKKSLCIYNLYKGFFTMVNLLGKVGVAKGVTLNSKGGWISSCAGFGFFLNLNSVDGFQEKKISHSSGNVVSYEAI